MRSLDYFGPVISLLPQHPEAPQSADHDLGSAMASGSMSARASTAGKKPARRSGRVIGSGLIAGGGYQPVEPWNVWNRRHPPGRRQRAEPHQDAMAMAMGRATLSPMRVDDHGPLSCFLSI
jgi:hypothetical protein